MDADHLSQEWDNAPMPHTMFFDMHGHAIHGFFDVKHLGSPVSHGCVRRALANAATLFALVQGQGMSQTTVVVSGQAPARGGEEMARRRAPAQQLGHGAERIAYVDIDAHHGDGVQAAFYADPRVLTISVHEHPATLFPFTGLPAETGGPGAEGQR